VPAAHRVTYGRASSIEGSTVPSRLKPQKCARPRPNGSGTQRASSETRIRGVSGWSSAAPCCRPRWANGAGQRRIAYGLPGDDGTMRFQFAPGDPNYSKLVSTPGLTARIVVDRATSHIMSVRFHGRRRRGRGVTPPSRAVPLRTGAPGVVGRPSLARYGDGHWAPAAVIANAAELEAAIRAVVYALLES
jgi:hypothetical protein